MLPTHLVGKLIGDDGKAIAFYNVKRNEIRYVHRGRIFNEKVTTAYDEEKGKALVKELLSYIGMTEAEANLEYLQSKILKAGIVSDLKTTPCVKNAIDVETTFFLPRVVNGLIVEESYYIVGVSNEGQVSNFRIRWPVLKTIPLENREVLSKNTMAAKILENLSANESNCQRAPQLFSIKLAYMPSVASDGDENDQFNDITNEIVYSLKVMVRYMSSSNYEGDNVEMFDVF